MIAWLKVLDLMNDSQYEEMANSMRKLTPILENLTWALANLRNDCEIAQRLFPQGGSGKSEADMDVDGTNLANQLSLVV